MQIGAVPDDVPDDTYGLFTWNCERGAELVTGTSVQFHNFIATDNWKAGISFLETQISTFGLGNTMALVRSIVIGRSMADQELEDCGDIGIETPWELFAFTGALSKYFKIP